MCPMFTICFKPEYRATTRKLTQLDKEFFHGRLVAANADCPEKDQNMKCK